MRVSAAARWRCRERPAFASDGCLRWSTAHSTQSGLRQRPWVSAGDAWVTHGKLECLIEADVRPRKTSQDRRLRKAVAVLDTSDPFLVNRNGYRAVSDQDCSCVMPVRRDRERSLRRKRKAANTQNEHRIDSRLEHAMDESRLRTSTTVSYCC